MTSPLRGLEFKPTHSVALSFNIFFIFFIFINIAMGRTAKDKNVIGVENLKVNLISKKQNQYGDEILYFKIVDKDIKPKMKLIKAVADSTPSLRMPFFTGDNNQVILRIKENISVIQLLQNLKRKLMMLI